MSVPNHLGEMLEESHGRDELRFWSLDSSRHRSP